MSINHENLKFTDKALPVCISQKTSNSKYKGSLYHWHEQIEIYYVVNGGVKLRCNGKEQWLYKGDVALVNWCEPHKGFEFLDNTLHYIIQVDITSPPLSQMAMLKKFPNYYDNILINNLMNEIIHEYNEEQKGYQYIIYSNIIKLFGILLRQYNCDNTVNERTNLSHIKYIMSYIHENCNKQIELDMIACSVEITKPHMCRIFKMHTGNTITSYINTVRINNAMNLIKDGYSITEASEMTGFNDYNYFSRCFKKIMGYAPSKTKKSDL